MFAAFRLVQGARRLHQPADARGPGGRCRRGVGRQPWRGGRLCRHAARAPATIFVPERDLAGQSWSGFAATAPNWWSAARAMPRRWPPAKPVRRGDRRLADPCLRPGETLLGQGTLGLEIEQRSARHRHAAGRGRRRRADRRHRRLVCRPHPDHRRRAGRRADAASRAWRPATRRRAGRGHRRRIRWRPSASAR